MIAYRLTWMQPNDEATDVTVGHSLHLDYKAAEHYAQRIIHSAPADEMYPIASAVSVEIPPGSRLGDVLSRAPDKSLYAAVGTPDHSEIEQLSASPGAKKPRLPLYPVFNGRGKVARYRETPQC